MLSERKKLSGQEREKLWKAILDAYPNKANLKMMLSFKLETKLDEIAGGEDLNEVIFNLIEWAESQGQSKELVKAACEGNPGNQKLQDIRKELFPKLSDNVYTENKKLSVITEKWGELLPILSELDLQLMANICKDTIKKLNKNIDITADYYELQNIKKISTIKEVLLKSYIPPDTGAQIIVEFIERLSNAEEIDESQKNQLCQLVKTVAEEHNIKLPTYQKKKSSNISQYYLLVVANPKGKNEFYLTAELMLDNKIIPIDELKYEQRKIDCKLSEISGKIYDFLKVFRKKYLKPIDNDYTLIIELFMPLEYLDTNVDIQEIKGGLGDEITIGEQYQFIIRCSERIMAEDGEFLIPLRNKWKKYSNDFDYIPPKTTYEEWDWINCNFKGLANNWQNDDKNISGVNIICGLPENYKLKRQLFTSIIRAGIPICLWTRDNNLPNIENQFNEIFTCKLESLDNLDTLLKSVLRIRKKAHAQTNKEKYLGYHLGFLCDNPDRIPFCLRSEELEFYEPGM